MSRKEHWENVYTSKQPHEVSWTQEKPEHSLRLIEECNTSKSARIIDVGGGDSNLVDHLLELGYENITVLDISEQAIERAKTRLGENARKVTWIVSDITNFQPSDSYTIWHDRAAFHFLTSKEDIEKYTRLVEQHANRHLILAAFSKNGPLKCSGLEITQYSEETLNDLFASSFSAKECFYDDHTTPFQTNQNFLYSRFEKK